MSSSLCRIRTVVSTGWREIFTRPAQRDAALDGLRAIACIWVVGVHTISFLGSFWLDQAADIHVLDRETFTHVLGHPWLRILQKGYMGVDLFFVLTGFLMGRLLLGELHRSGTINVPRFYHRRLLRLFPAYAVVMVLDALLVRDNTGTAWANVLYVNNFLPTYRQFMLHGWSLAVEQQYYLLLPLVLLAVACFGRLRSAHVLIGIAAGIALRALVIVKYHLYVNAAPNPAVNRATCELYNDLFDDKLHTQFGSMLSGLLAALAMTRQDAGRWLQNHRWASILGLAIAGATIYAIVSPSPVADPHGSPGWAVAIYMILFQPLFAAAIALILFMALRRCGPTPGFFRFLEHPAWFPIAQLSYGVYLVHLLIIKLVYAAAPPVAPSAPVIAALWLGFVVASLALAIPLFILIESPFMRLRSSRKPAEGPGQAADRGAGQGADRGAGQGADRPASQDALVEPQIS